MSRIKAMLAARLAQLCREWEKIHGEKWWIRLGQPASEEKARPYSLGGHRTLRSRYRPDRDWPI